VTNKVEWIGFGEMDPWGATPESHTSPTPWSFAARIETEHADQTASVIIEGFGVVEHASEGTTPGHFRRWSGVTNATRSQVTKATSALPADETLLGVATRVLRACLGEGQSDAAVHDLLATIQNDTVADDVRALAVLAVAVLVREVD
jgi:hypothetical protein